MQTDDKGHATILNMDTNKKLVITKYWSPLGYDVQSTLKTEAEYFFETLGSIYEKTIRCHNPQDHNKSHKLTTHLVEVLIKHSADVYICSHAVGGLHSLTRADKLSQRSQRITRRASRCWWFSTAGRKQRVSHTKCRSLGSKDLFPRQFFLLLPQNRWCRKLGVLLAVSNRGTNTQIHLLYCYC
jgi:hypothetical protein